MYFTPSGRPTNITTELAKERSRQAAERTLASWIQNCLVLIGFGIAFDRIFAAVNQTFPENNPIINTEWTQIIGLSAIALGILLMLLMIIGYLNTIKRIERATHSQEAYLKAPSHFVNLSIIVGGIILFGLVAIIAVCINAILIA